MTTHISDRRGDVTVGDEVCRRHRDAMTRARISDALIVRVRGEQGTA